MSPATGKPLEAVMNMNLSFNENDRKRIGTVLGTLLADEFALGAQIRSCRWNVTTRSSRRWKRLVASHEEKLDEVLDCVGKRARETKNSRTAALADFFKLTQCEAEPREVPSKAQIAAELLATHEAVLVRLRRNLETCTEVGGAEFFNAMIAKHESMAMELRSLMKELNQDESTERAQRE
jgi:starvation-inducible DNA-binding protein